MTAPRPLGHWLTTVDRLLGEQFERVAEAEGVTPTGWQLLVRLRTSAVAVDAVESLAAARGDIDVVAELERLDRARLVDHQGTEWRLTDAGHARVAEIETAGQAAIRERLATVLTDEEYDDLVAMLERIATSLDGA